MTTLSLCHFGNLQSPVVLQLKQLCKSYLLSVTCITLCATHNDKQTAYTVTLRMSTKRQNKLSQCCTSPETEKNKGRVYSWLALKPVLPAVFSLEKNSIWNVKVSANLIENVVFIMSNNFTRPIQLFRETIKKSLS